MEKQKSSLEMRHVSNILIYSPLSPRKLRNGPVSYPIIYVVNFAKVWVFLQMRPDNESCQLKHCAFTVKMLL